MPPKAAKPEKGAAGIWFWIAQSEVAGTVGKRPKTVGKTKKIKGSGD
jgi:hypothetical protein